ncbi:uncharacterized protein B0H18DRAFT_1191006 [Fomitopsis serialis]|uniref:uncharacterized protein n=1 Tax=Fomitopsis serialis TaxID=139415 RepID=UPI0020080213|nr:uncharacterized protein B0H18DRAFT_1191006 [Neoantrodia serialis]KAH9920754.1 hypothetical protein B0H18DRAFT_1191006 [Neoantrodia serialis]
MTVHASLARCSTLDTPILALRVWIVPRRMHDPCMLCSYGKTAFTTHAELGEIGDHRGRQMGCLKLRGKGAGGTRPRLDSARPRRRRDAVHGARQWHGLGAVVPTQVKEQEVPARGNRTPAPAAPTAGAPRTATARAADSVTAQAAVSRANAGVTPPGPAMGSPSRDEHRRAGEDKEEVARKRANAPTTDKPSQNAVRADQCSTTWSFALATDGADQHPLNPTSDAPQSVESTASYRPRALPDASGLAERSQASAILIRTGVIHLLTSSAAVSEKRGEPPPKSSRKSWNVSP